MAKEQTTGFGERVLWFSLYGTYDEKAGGQPVRNQLHYGFTPETRELIDRAADLPALDQEHQHREDPARGDRVEVDRGDPEGARPQGADRPGAGAADVAGAERLMAGEVALGASADEAVAILRETTPFGDVPGAFLARIAAIARPARYARRRAHLQRRTTRPTTSSSSCPAGSSTSSAPEVRRARAAAGAMTRGGVFGWAGLLLGQTRRLATVSAARADRSAAHQHRGAGRAARVRAARGRARRGALRRA